MSDKCKALVIPKKTYGSFHKYQCTSNVWMDGYCKQHHPVSVQKREDKSIKRYEEQIKKTPWYLLKQATEKIAELERQLTDARERISELTGGK